MPAKKNPWMPLYGADFFSHRLVRLMTREQRCLYLELLWFAWNNGGIPKDLDEIACVLDMDPDRFRDSHWSRLAPAWEPHPDRDDLLVNPRQEEERNRRTGIAQQRRAAGQASAANRRDGNG